MWFTESVEGSNPGIPELQAFLTGVQNFLSFVLERNEFSFLWGDHYSLREMAFDTYQNDVVPSIQVLRDTVPFIHPIAVINHGLAGRPLRFKLKVIDTIANGWDRVQRQFSIREWFKSLIDAIDALLDSLIDAAGGVGGLIKEFKDALGALARTV